MNVAIVLDTSASMAAPNKIGVARRAIASFAAELGERDELALVGFSDHASVLLPSGPVDQALLRRRLGALYEGGGGNVYAGMERGGEEVARTRRGGERAHVVVISDGGANVGVTGPEARARLIGRLEAQGVRVTTLQVGQGGHQATDTLIEALRTAVDPSRSSSRRRFRAGFGPRVKGQE